MGPVLEVSVTCTMCGEVKPADRFTATRQRECKECTAIRHRKYYLKNKDRIITRTSEYTKRNREKRNVWYAEYCKTARVKAMRRKVAKKWYNRNRVKVNAHQAVRRAIKSGDLVRQPCEVCGEKPAHGHHDDYAKQLDVRWLCRVHHRDLHTQCNRRQRQS